MTRLAPASIVSPFASLFAEVRSAVRRAPIVLAAFAMLLPLALPATAADGSRIESLLASLRAVGPKGQGGQEAAKAWTELAQSPATDLPTILAGMDGANLLATNWIGSAADAIAQRQLDAGESLPSAELERFLMDTRRSARARSLVYQWLSKADPTLPARALPKMLDDPNPDLRRDAVAQLIAEAGNVLKTSQPEAVAKYEKAFRSARDWDQIQLIAGRLNKLGKKLDVRTQLGIVTRWKVIGPWDNTDTRGFDAVYPPEQETTTAPDGSLDFTKTYPGKPGKPDEQGKPRIVKWTDFATTQPQGEVDLNKAVVEERWATAYAAVEIQSDRAQPIQVRCGAHNALKIWLNGRLIASYNAYHAGGQFDQYSCDAALKPGRNTLLVKICQNNQPQAFAGDWKFMLRVCDPSGGPIAGTIGAPEKADTKETKTTQP